MCSLFSPVLVHCRVALPVAQGSGLVHGVHDPEYPVHAHREPRQRDRRGADGEQDQRQCLLENGREQLQDVRRLLCFSLTLCQCEWCFLKGLFKYSVSALKRLKLSRGKDRVLFCCLVWFSQYFLHTWERVSPSSIYSRTCLKMLGGEKSNILAFVSRCDFFFKKNEINIKLKCSSRRFMSHGVYWSE